MSRPNDREDLIEALYAASIPDPQRIRETWADAILASGWVADLREDIAVMLDKVAEDAGPHYVYGLREAARLIREEAFDENEPTPPPCMDHREVQHRDRKPPWCNTCGWRHGRPAQPPVQLRTVNDAP